MLRELVTTARLVLKPLTVADAEEMVSVLAAPELYAFIGGEPPGLEGLRTRYERLVRGGPADGSCEQEWHNWIVRRVEDGVTVGTVQATVVDATARTAAPAADVAWVIGVAFQGRGYAVEAASAMVAWLRERGVAEIRAHIHPDHAASARVAERIGLVPTGVLDDEGEQIWRSVQSAQSMQSVQSVQSETMLMERTETAR